MTVAEAAAKGDLVQLRILLENGGDPNEAATDENDSPLVEAAYKNHAEAARLLLDAGADMYAPTPGGETALERAIAWNSMDVFRLLVERGCRLDTTTDRIGYLFKQAAGQGLLEAVEWMLAQGVEVDAVDYTGGTALTSAAHSNHLEIVETLLKAGANPSHVDDDTETVLMWAADHAGNAAVLRTLVAAGADVNIRNDVGQTALTWVMRHGDAEMAMVLLEGGSVILPNDLTLATFKGVTDAVRLLLAWGAEATVENLESARKGRHREVANLLRQALEDQRLRQAEEVVPPPHFPIGTPVRTLVGTPREGWIVYIEWHHKYRRYAYYIEVPAMTQARKNVTGRYWEEELHRP